MRVQVKPGCVGWHDNMLRKEGQEFILKDVTCVKRKDEKGKPLVITAEQQFSHNWMIQLEEPAKPQRKKPGPKPKLQVIEEEV